MKKQFKIIMILLALLCMLLFIQVIEDVKVHHSVRRNFVTKIASGAEAISANLEFVIEKQEETYKAALGVTRTYLDFLVKCFYIPDYAFRYNILWRQYDFLQGLQDDGYMVVTFIQKEYETIYQKNLVGEELSKEDFEYLRELKAACDKLYDALTDENHSLNKNATSPEYFTKCFNEFAERMYRLER